MTELEQAYYDHGRKMLKNLKHREFLYREMAVDPEVAELEKKMCLWQKPIKGSEPIGIHRFFENHLWTHEPRPHVLKAYGPEFIGVPQLPFLLFGIQKDAVDRICYAIDNGEDILIEKSRDMGISWIVISVFLYYWWKPEAGNDFLLGSRKYDYVDKKGALDTLFQKFRYSLYRMQKSIRPQGFEENKHDNVGFIQNPESGSYARGEANNENFGTSGRYKAVLVDEFSKWEETDSAAWTSLGDTTRCRIPVSTPWGIGRKFAQLRESGAIEVLTYHWSEHPIKGVGKYRGNHPYIPERKDVWLSPWYLEECERRKDDPRVNIGQELDIDYLSSGAPYFNNHQVSERLKALQEKKLNVHRYAFQAYDRNINVFPDANGPIYIYKQPEIGWKYRYCIGCDVAEGLEHGDNSVFYIYDRVEKQDVMWFVGKPDTTTLANLLMYYGHIYDYCWIAVERNNEGSHVVNKMKESYVHLMHEMDFTKVVDLTKIRVGWHTNTSTRGTLLGDLRTSVHEGYDGITDEYAYREMMTFVYNKNGKPEADTGCKDDRVFAQGIKWQIHKWLDSPRKDVKSEEKIYDVPRFGGAIADQKEDVRNIWII